MGNGTTGCRFRVFLYRDHLLLLEGSFERPPRRPVETVAVGGACCGYYLTAREGQCDDVAGYPSDFGYLSAAADRWRLASLVGAGSAWRIPRKDPLPNSRRCLC